MKYTSRIVMGALVSLLSFNCFSGAQALAQPPVFRDFHGEAGLLGKLTSAQPSEQELSHLTQTLLHLYLWTKDSFAIQQEPEQEKFIKQLSGYIQRLERAPKSLPEVRIKALKAAYLLLLHEYEQAMSLAKDASDFELRLVLTLVGEPRPDNDQVWRIPLAGARQLVKDSSASVLAGNVLVEAILEAVGESEHKQKLLQEAEQVLKAKQRLAPENLYLQYQLAQTYYLQERQSEAFALFGHLLKQAPQSYVLAESSGNFYFWMKEYQRSAEAYGLALRVNPLQTRLYRKLEQVYLRLEAPDQALKLYLNGLLKMPSEGAFYQASKDLLMQSEPEKTLIAVEQGLKQAPGNLYLQLFKGDVLSLLERPKEAESAYQRAIQLNSVIPIAYENLFQLLWKQKDFEAMHALIERARQKPGVLNATRYWAGLVYLQEHQPELAVEELEKASLKDQGVRYALVMAYRQNKQFDKAKNLLQELLKESPRDLNLLLSMGDVYFEEKNMTKAEDYYLWANKIEPYHPSVYFSLGNLYSDSGRPHLARQAFERLILMAPEDLDARNNLGNVLLKERNFREAVQHFETILRMNPEYATAYYNMACAYSLTRQKDTALRFLKQALERDQNLKKLAMTDPDLDNLRQEKSFQELVH